MDPLEAVLKAIASWEPRPWFPKIFAADRGADLNQIYMILELLHLEGLIVSGPTDHEYGPSVVLTPAGREVLADPEKLTRLRSGQALRPGDRGGEVREVFRVQPRGTLTSWILYANLAVFAYACYLAWSVPGLLRLYAFSLPGTLVPPWLLVAIGAVQPEDVQEGRWWRMLTCTFAHLGFLHLLMNMFALRGAGKSTELMWGGWRYLLIYFIAGWGGCCMGMAWQPGLSLGASGALCGVLAAESAWFFLNRRYLPRSAFSRFVGAFVINTGLIAMLSFLPGVGWAAHLGGALFGLAAALCLHVQRYGLPMLRWPALVVALLLPLGGYQFMQYQIHQPEWSPTGRVEEFDRFTARDGDFERIARSIRETEKWFGNVKDGPMPQLDRRPERRDAAAVAATMKDLSDRRTRVEELREFMNRLRYRDESVVEFLKASQKLSRAWLDVLDRATSSLRQEANWEGDQEPTLKALKTAQTEWVALLKR